MIERLKKRLLIFSATVLNYFSVYGFNYKRLLSDVTYERFFQTSN
jgi:hypothetical protein